jgi:hypothetical protein
MDNYGHTLSEDALTTLFAKNLPMEKVPEHVNKRVQQKVFTVLREQKRDATANNSGIRVVDNDPVFWQGLVYALQG